MANSTPSLSPGTLLEGVYRVGKVLGEGGMGCVYEAVNVDINRRVAVKHLHDQFIDNEEVVERFHREARLAASIGHDNICEVIDFDRADDGSPFLVMPLLEGQTLADMLAKQKMLSLERVTDILCQTLSALQAAHDNQIIHRDMKPENIFITTMGDRPDFVKILDFGISKILSHDSVTNLTQTGLLIGTPHYMSPEQAQGAREIDQRTDIWAVGVILYEALTGRRPFMGDTYLAVLNQICRGELTPPTEVNGAIPAVFEEVTLRALSPSLDERYQHADEMRIALSEALVLHCGLDVLRSRAPSEYYRQVPSVPPMTVASMRAMSASLKQKSSHPAASDADTEDIGTPLSVVTMPPKGIRPWRWIMVTVVLAAVTAVVSVYLLFGLPDRSSPQVIVPAGGGQSVPADGRSAPAGDLSRPPKALSGVVPDGPTKDADKDSDKDSAAEEPAPAGESPTPAPTGRETRQRSSSRNRKPPVEEAAPPAKETEPAKAPPERRSKNSVKGRFKTEIDAEY